jgi:MFS-type transporter involved in bile tolerance (Atg22 family)
MLLAMLAPEKPLVDRPPALDWTPFLRLAMMTALFTAIILAMGGLVRLAGRVALSLGSPAGLLAVMGLAGLLAMLVAVALGVWMSVRISLGASARQNPSFVWWVINRLAFLAGAVNLSTFAVYFIQARLGFVRETAARPASILMLVVGVCILLSALPGGWLADRFGHQRLVAYSGLAAALGTLIALLYPSLTLIYAGGVLIGVATGVFFTANWSLGTALAPPGEAGRYLGLANLAGAGAGAVGAYIGGPIADFFTTNLPAAPGVGYVLLFSIYGVLFLVSVAAVARVKDDRGPTTADRQLPKEVVPLVE